MAKISWHIEPTSRCTLECPMCDRTWFYEKFKKRLTHDIDIDHLIRFLSDTSPSVHLCGNNGDPIYHKRFHELCAKLKSIGSRISISTNGSGKTTTWWKKLCSILSEDDSIQFSIDGLEDTNHLYRKNAKWQSIMEAISTVTNYNTKTVWKFIIFKHNQHQIEDARKFSQSLGIADFRLIKSDRWWKKELMPDEQYVNPIYKHQISVTKNKDSGSGIQQQCMSVTNGLPDTRLYIDSAGDFYPCCYLGLYAYRHKNIFDPRQKKYNIRDNTIQEILGRPEVQSFFDDTKEYQSAHKCCKINCGVPKTMIEKNSKL